MNSTVDIDQLSPDQIHQLALRLLAENRFKQTVIDKLTHENAVLKRLRFAAKSEAYTGEQQRELFETFDIDLAAVTTEIEQLALTNPAPT